MENEYIDLYHQQQQRQHGRRPSSYVLPEQKYPPFNYYHYHYYVHPYSNYSPMRNKQKDQLPLLSDQECRISTERSRTSDNQKQENDKHNRIKVNHDIDLEKEFQNINVNYHLEDDMEPMNEQEILAAINAIINERDLESYKKEEDDNVPIIAAEPNDKNLITQDYNIISPTETHKVPTLKKWLFSLMSNKGTSLWGVKKTIKKETANDFIQNYNPMTANSHIAPTPVLSPDSFNTTTTTTTNTNTNTTPSPINHFSLQQQHQQSPQVMHSNDVCNRGSPYWYFRYHCLSNWLPFDPINQQKIQHHLLHCPYDILIIIDSHFKGGHIPIFALPCQQIAYCPIDFTLTQFITLELHLFNL
ncbi:uncharacterized protein BX663DRAFT_526321 [Cokeromyces recurvatus]|uniref:uncharacterized protein n=1 Tax=Cokeromyces recurvatus TaxID=90255 RepID=UPI00221E5DF9|nr:uncharacterized protein BX663DRAFT_526321 [Cokeromyces recurvatus]KAI7898013.1 hypothetical protein BX663DRAFT_526321 [Cokeromyces recurvatus]